MFYDAVEVPVDTNSSHSSSLILPKLLLVLAQKRSGVTFKYKCKDDFLYQIN